MINPDSLILNWGTEDYKGFDESRSSEIQVDVTSSSRDYAFDLSENENWQGYIDQLKLTFKTGIGSKVKIDHISFESNNLYDCNTDWNGGAVVDNCNVCTGGNTNIEPCVVSNLSEKKLNGQYKLYPNPTTGKLFLEESVPFKVFTIMGELIQKGNSDFIDLSKHPSGIYLINLGQKNHKVIVKQ